MQTVFPVNSDGTFHILVPGTPVGCRGIFDNNTKTCSVTFDLDDSDGCSAALGTNQHPLCGITLTGLTVAGLKYYKSWETSYSYVFYNYTYDYNTGMSSNEVKGTKVMIDDSTSHNTSNIFHVRFGPLSLPESIWDGYRMPDYKVCVCLLTITVF